MIPHHLEYVFLLVLYLLVIASLYTYRVIDCLCRRSFWQSFGIFGLSWTVIELIGLHLGMWEYSSERTCGLGFLGIPIEEYVIFFLIHLATIASWETFSHDRRELP